MKDVNFEVNQGDMVGVIGKNGAGKSTLLKLLSRVTSPTTGSIKIKGRIAALLEVGTGFHPELTGRENVFLNGAILGMSKTEIASKLDEIVAFSGCEMYIDTPVKRYSSGMKVRLGFAVAAHLEPEILIIDEVLAVWLKEIDKLDRDNFHKFKNKIYGKYKLPKPIPSIELIERYNELIATWELEEDLRFKKILRKRWVRSQSGVTVISLLTKFWGCPWLCVYCPTFEWLPKSYIPNEPAVMRAELNKFDPIMQIHNRLHALEITGHKIEKNDIRIIWGTWSFYPEKYQEDFIKWIYDAFNTYDEMKKHIEKTDLST